MKEGHMKNGQLKPGYNIQMGTENQFVVGFSIHQRPADTGCTSPHLEHLKGILGRLPENIIADLDTAVNKTTNTYKKNRRSGIT
jgi:hypothetical protein